MVCCGNPGVGEFSYTKLRMQDFLVTPDRPCGLPTTKTTKLGVTSAATILIPKIVGVRSPVC